MYFTCIQVIGLRVFVLLREPFFFSLLLFLLFFNLWVIHTYIPKIRHPLSYTLNPLTPMSDQDRNSLNTIPSRQVMRTYKGF